MRRSGITHERLIAICLLGAWLFTSPFLDIFNAPARAFGLPRLYLYLFGAWALVIALVALVIENSEPDEDGASDPPSTDSDVGR
jgi:hypothetical protein